MNIACLFVKRKSLMESPPELICAWDEWSIEENPDGWVVAYERELAAVGDDLGASRYVNIRIPDARLDEIFREWKTVEGDVTEIVP